MIAFAAIVAFQLSASLPTRDIANVRALMDRARAARLQQDSLLDRYEVVVRQRLSSAVGLTMGRVPLGPVGRDRLAARIESVAKVGWSQELGAWGEVIAARSVIPIIGLPDPQSENEDVAIVLPYYPGRDRLWPTSEIRNALPSHDTWIEHPLSPGADSLYEFSIGDSISRLTLACKWAPSGGDNATRGLRRSPV